MTWLSQRKSLPDHHFLIKNGGLNLLDDDKLGCPLSQDASHHQDDITFLVGNPELNLHLPQLLGGGETQMINL